MELKVDAERIREDLAQDIYSSQWYLMFGLPVLVSVVILVSGLISGRYVIVINPKTSGGSK